MQPIIAERRALVPGKQTALVKVKDRGKPDHVPSKFSYRMERLWLTRWFRDMVRVWLPLGAVIIAAYAAYNSPTLNSWVAAKVEAVRDVVAERPELRIERVSIPVGSSDLQRQILGIMDLELPVSALDVDLADLRDLVLGLNAVKFASITFESGELEVAIVERVPAMVWRNLNRIYLLDKDGVLVAEVARRAVRSDLPLVVGEGADRAMLEAREIFSVLEPVLGKVLGLVRMGERRWDVVFATNVVKLPAEGGADALRRVMEMQRRDDVLARDVSVIDMRNPDRIILRVNEEAIREMRRVRARLHGERA
ncbi:MAG: cell division protein FtsQ/DivIB [Rhodobacteraceae bacterium]|nr:cell division protein FtsQ/DivIB [Paracoccaceae bacterium]